MRNLVVKVAVIGVVGIMLILPANTIYADMSINQQKLMYKELAKELGWETISDNEFVRIDINTMLENIADRHDDLFWQIALGVAGIRMTNKTENPFCVKLDMTDLENTADYTTQEWVYIGSKETESLGFISTEGDGKMIFTPKYNYTRDLAKCNYGKNKTSNNVSKPPLTEIEMVFVKGGCYQMGDILVDGGNDEKPIHEVCLDSFEIGKYEVTQGMWQVVMGENPSHLKKGANYPVEQVSWHDVQRFISKLNNKTGKSYRLPTEAEWEYAARSGGKQQTYADRENIDALAWHEGNSDGTTHPVGQKQANGLGLFDMSGNVWEWCQDWYAFSYYAGSSHNNPKGPSSGSNRVLRGGSWGSKPAYARASYRFYNDPELRYRRNGFRLVHPAW